MRIIRAVLFGEGAALPPWQRKLGPALVIAAMIVGVLCVYLPPRGYGQQLVGADYSSLHKYRIQYAQEALFGEDPHLPGWYSRELMGSPFWSNIQSFPFVPTRLLLLFLPSDVAFQVGIVLAALLSAVFTYLYCRSRGMARHAAAAAGWTFACSGYFASRVLGGHLPLLEAYPALPLLLWLAETAIQKEAVHEGFRPRLLALGLSALAVALCGHPQLPIYAFAATACYILYRDFGRRAAKRIAVLVLGGSAAAFCLWPMALLTRQSTRFLGLDAPTNDAVFPFARLKAFLFPWMDGWPSLVGRSPPTPFAGYPSRAYFWDTVCYVGILPIVAVLGLAAFAVARRHSGERDRHRLWIFFAVAGAAALLTALPPLRSILGQIPCTILRSPARQTYITIFCLSLGFGALIHVLSTWRSPSPKARLAALAVALVCIGVQISDLSVHDHSFIRFMPLEQRDDVLYQAVQEAVGDQRVSVDRGLATAINRRFDDVGFFDSAILGRPYRAVMSLSGQRPGNNTQVWDGWQMNARALSYLGVKLVFTRGKYRGAKRYALKAPLPVYGIPNPSSRAAFFPRAAARFFDSDKIHGVLRRQSTDLRGIIMLPPDAEPEGFGRDPTDGRGSGSEGDVIYRRESADRISCTVRAEREGYLRLLESWYQGFEARVDGKVAAIIVADDFAMAVHLPPGRHDVTFEYSTPGKWTGLTISIVSLALMTLLIFSDLLGPRRRTGA
jgi:hypothetical protein